MVRRTLGTAAAEVGRDRSHPAGVQINAVADLLGHSSIAITGDLSGHASDDTTRAAVDGLLARLGL
jgi:integrase